MKCSVMFVDSEASLKNASTKFDREPITQLHKCLVTDDSNQAMLLCLKKLTQITKMFLQLLIERLLLNHIRILPYYIPVLWNIFLCLWKWSKSKNTSTRTDRDPVTLPQKWLPSQDKNQVGYAVLFMKTKAILKNVSLKFDSGPIARLHKYLTT